MTQEAQWYSNWVNSPQYAAQGAQPMPERQNGVMTTGIAAQRAGIGGRNAEADMASWNMANPNNQVTLAQTQAHNSWSAAGGLQAQANAGDPLAKAACNAAGIPCNGGTAPGSPPAAPVPQHTTDTGAEVGGKEFRTFGGSGPKLDENIGMEGMRTGDGRTRVLPSGVGEKRNLAETLGLNVQALDAGV